MNHTRPLLEKLAARTLANSADKNVHPDFVINMANWQWHQGVALFGLWRAGEALGDPRITEYVTAWFDERLVSGRMDKRINTTAPLLTAAYLYEKTGNPAYASLCQEYADWCLAEAPRLPDGTFEHDPIFPRQVWADTLFMSCLFLAKWGCITNQPRYINEAVAQFKKHYHYLHDARTGLAFHGYDDVKKAHIGTLWGRGNGWMAMALVELLAMLGPAHPACADVREIMNRQFAGILATQHADGSWRTVMDVPETYVESTCTAAFACAFRNAIALGIAGDELAQPARRAMDRVLGWVTAQGELTRASAGTPLQQDALEYNKIPCAATAFSQGIAMICLSSALRPLSFAKTPANI